MRQDNCERCWIAGRQFVGAIGAIDEQNLCKSCGIEVAVEMGDAELELAWRAKGRGAVVQPTEVEQRDRPRSGPVEAIADVVHDVLRQHEISPAVKPVPVTTQIEKEPVVPKPKANCKCGKGLRADSPGFKFGLCAKCHRIATEPAETVVKRKPGRPSTRNAAAIEPAEEIYVAPLTLSLAVTPEWLEKAWSRFDVDRRLAAVAHVLQS